MRRAVDCLRSARSGRRILRAARWGSSPRGQRRSDSLQATRSSRQVLLTHASSTGTSCASPDELALLASGDVANDDERVAAVEELVRELDPATGAVFANDRV